MIVSPKVFVFACLLTVGVIPLGVAPSGNRPMAERSTALRNVYEWSFNSLFWDNIGSNSVYD